MGWEFEPGGTTPFERCRRRRSAAHTRVGPRREGVRGGNGASPHITHTQRHTANQLTKSVDRKAASTAQLELRPQADGFSYLDFSAVRRVHHELPEPGYRKRSRVR